MCAPGRVVPDDVLAFEQDAAGRRAQHAGEKIDDRRFPGAVRADQGMTSPLFDRQRNPVHGSDAAEVLFEALRGEHGGHHQLPSAGGAAIRNAGIGRR